jgi:hypothetical protein
VGVCYAGVDDFPVITPRFDTFLSIRIDALDLYAEGPFADVAYNKEANKKAFFTADPYSMYGWSSHEKTYVNPAAANDVTVLSIRDSFACVTTTFLPLLAARCHELDMRFYTGDFAAQYAELAPDIVIVLVNASSGVPSANTGYDFLP